MQEGTVPMRFSLFAHVERFDGATPWPQLYGELQELVQVAEDGGFAAFWTGEHYGMEFTVGPDPLTLLVHLAAQTRSIRLVTGNIVAPFWHPVRLASEAAHGRRADERPDRARHRPRRLPVRVRPADGRHERDAGRQPPARDGAAAPAAVGRRRRARGRELVVPDRDQRPEARPGRRARDLDRGPRSRLPRLRGRERLRRLLHAAREGRHRGRGPGRRSSGRRARRIPTSRARV